MQKQLIFDRLRMLLFLGCAFVLFFFIARERKAVLGIEENDKQQDDNTTIIEKVGNNHYVINTTALSTDIIGFGGTTPVMISVTNDVIDSITPLSNSETPMFFSKATEVLDAYRGIDIKTADSLRVDATTGSTLSSTALIKNVQMASRYVKDNGIEEHHWWDSFDFSVKNIVALIVILSGAIVPLIYKNKNWRTVQLVLNVAVLGLWSGTFISHSLLLGVVGNGIHPIASIVPFLLLITAFIYPLFGRKSHYCNHLCPFGSAQELSGKLNKKKIHLSATTIKRLSIVRQVLWIVLITLMLVGVGFEWMDYELFTAFLYTTASPIVIGLAIVSLIFSAFVPRPYCRFVCPTGTLLKLIENNNT